MRNLEIAQLQLHYKCLNLEDKKPFLIFNILLHTQLIVCVTVDSQCLEYEGYITFAVGRNNL